MQQNAKDLPKNLISDLAFSEISFEQVTVSPHHSDREDSAPADCTSLKEVEISLQAFNSILGVPEMAFPKLNLENVAKSVKDGQHITGMTRSEVEIGLQAFNSIPGFLETIDSAIKRVPAIKYRRGSLELYCNSAVALFSDFTPHYKMLISANLINHTTGIDALVTGVHLALESSLQQSPFTAGAEFQLVVQDTKLVLSRDMITPAICVVLRIGDVFHLPVFTAYVVDHVFKNEVLMNSILLQSIEPEPFVHNGKIIQAYNRLDLLLELLLHSQESNCYTPVNAIVRRGVNALIVSKFNPTLTHPHLDPNVIIQRERNLFLDALFPHHLAQLCPAISKNLLIAIAQSPMVRTSDGKQFSDIFQSGLYREYFDEPVIQPPTTKSKDTAAIMLKNDDAGPMPLTRLDIIVAALTAFNNAAAPSEHIVVSGGAAVACYIAKFVKDVRLNASEIDTIFSDVMGAPGETLQDLVALSDCSSVAMNDIDCVVFGNASRRLLSVFSLYMLLLYDKFFAHPKRCDSRHGNSARKFVFNLAKASGNNITLFMNGNQNDDVNTQLISKRLKKNSQVQIVTQETKHYLQLVHPLCDGGDETSTLCKEDDCYIQPIDLVKKSIEHFVDMYVRSLYTPDSVVCPPGLESVVQKQYFEDNMVSLKTVMLDLICLCCDDASLFIRMFMARKNKKDFDRLRVVLDIYLVQLIRSDRHFAEINADFMTEARALRSLMKVFGKHYLERGNIVAADVATAAKVDAERNAFFSLLRKVGRKIVELPGPSSRLVPIPRQFQAASGRTTIQLFNSEFGFKMDSHTCELLKLYKGNASHDNSVEPHEHWFQSVLDSLDRELGLQNSSAFFANMLREILDKNTDDATQKDCVIGLKNMQVIMPSMLQLQHAHSAAQVGTEMPHQYVDARGA
jgi:hypothetical protein